MTLFVSDTGPLISFERIPGGYGLLRSIVSQVIIPRDVHSELSALLPEGADYLVRHGIADFVRIEDAPPAPSEAASLDPGERSAIALALSLGCPLLMEERQGRAVARSLGISITGAAGLVLAAWTARIIGEPAARSHLVALHRAGRIDRALLDDLLARIVNH